MKSVKPGFSLIEILVHIGKIFAVKVWVMNSEASSTMGALLVAKVVVLMPGFTHNE